MVNVGDLKNDELPLQFFLDYAWNPERAGRSSASATGSGSTPRRTSASALRRRRSPACSHDYGQLQSRRKPELLNRRITLDPAKDLATDSSAVVYDDQGNPFSLTDYREMDRVTAEWQAPGGARPSGSARRLPAGLRRTPTTSSSTTRCKATANLYALRHAEFTNILYAAAGPRRDQRPGRPRPRPGSPTTRR